jgi:hypothetical protein
MPDDHQGRTAVVANDLARQAALQYHAAGLSVIPARPDGSKAPAVSEWKCFQKRLPTREEVEAMFPPGEPRGVALIGGEVSGNLETMDFETVAAFEEWVALIRAQDESLLEKLIITETPGKYLGEGGSRIHGRHVRYRVAEFLVPGNLKLAYGEDGKSCLIETRGAGGYALAPGSCAEAHPAKTVYRNLQGAVSRVQTITEFERNLLIDAARSLNRFVRDGAEFAPAPAAGPAGDRPGDEFNRRADWSFLQRHGWQVVTGGTPGQRTTWRRPGKAAPGISATTGVCKGRDETDRLYVFSTNAAPFESERTYSPFAAYALLEHGSDFRKAAQAIGGAQSGRVFVGPMPEGLAADDEPAADATGELLEESDDVPAAMPFPVEALPEGLQRYVREVSETMRCPADFPGCFLLGVASIGIGNTRKIALKKGWTESVRLYLAVVAEPGSKKTPALDAICAPLYEWQGSLHDEAEQKRDDYRRDKEEYEAKKKAKDPTAVMPKRPVYRHVYTTDATTEKLADMLKDSPRGLGVIQDEVTALVQGMNQYKQGGKGRDRQFYLSAWSGSPAKVDRKSDEGTPIVIRDPFLSVLGGIQPELLGALKDEFGREDGFVHRFLFTYPATGQLDEWRDDQVSEYAERSWKDCFERLKLLSAHVEPDGKVRPWVVMMDGPARAAWKRWYDETNITVAHMEPVFQRPMQKMIGYAARLTLVVQMLRWACGETPVADGIEELSVINGCRLADYFTSHMQLVYTRLHEKADDWQAKELAVWVAGRGGQVTVRDVVTYGPRWARKKSLAIKKLQDLEDRGLGIYGETKKDNGTVTRWFAMRKNREMEDL